MFTLLQKKTPDLGPDRGNAAGRFIKLVIAQAVAAQATKIVLGEPCESDYQRVPWNPRLVQDCPWDWEDVARLSGRSEADVVKERETEIETWRKMRAERRVLPLWFKINGRYEELSPAPASLFFDILPVIKSWDQGRIPWKEEKPDWDKVADLLPQLPVKDALSSLLLKLPSPLPDKGALSSFLLRLEDGRIIEAALGFEPSFCLSISVDDTGRKI